MKIVAVIVTYNAMRWVDRCMQSLRESFIPVRPVVIDNGSTDGTRSYLPAHYPEAVWMPQEENLGFGQANNLGLRYTLEHNADYALLLNQDAWIDRQMLVQLIRFSDQQTILSPIQMNGQATDFDRLFRQNTIRRSSDITSLHEVRIGDFSRPFRADAAAAACWLIPRSIIETVGGFNPLFFQYGEDSNYLCRAFYHGFSLKVVPTAFMCHDRDTAVSNKAGGAGEGQSHGNPQLYQRRIVYRYLLLHATDIRRRPTLRHSLRICGFWCREGLHSKRFLRMIWESLAGLFLIFRNRKAILSSREQEQTSSPSWL